MRRKNDKSGQWFNDSYAENVSGFLPLHAAVNDGLEGLRKEIDSLHYSLFPLVEVPVKSRPGYVSHEHNYFHINFKEPTIKDFLEDYFLSKHSRHSSDLYGSSDDFAGLLTDLVQDLLTYGKVYYHVEWGNVEFNKKQYVLPISFSRLDTLTVKKSVFGGYVQKYSFWAYFFDHHFQKLYGQTTKPKRVYRFEDENILTFTYPFGITPVQRTYKFVKKLRNFWQFGINQQRTTLEPENHSFSIEYARHTTYNQEHRKYLLLKSKLKTYFNSVVEPSLNITTYYDVYTVTRYLKKLNDLRLALISDFNNQIMQQIFEKNNLPELPEVYFDHFLTNDEVDNLFKEFVDGKITVQEYGKAVTKK